MRWVYEKTIDLNIKDKPMSTLIDEVKKEIDAKELEAKKEKIRKMLELISTKEKNLDATIKKQEEWVSDTKEYIAKLKDQLEKEDYSAVEQCLEGANFRIITNGFYTYTL